MGLFTLLEGEQNAEGLWLTPFCSTINWQLPFNQFYSSSFTMQTSESPSQKWTQITPKHSTRNPNKTQDKKFQGVCCSQKHASSPAKIWALVLGCPQLLTTQEAASGPEGLPFWLSHYPSVNHSLCGQHYLPCTSPKSTPSSHPPCPTL